MIDATAVNGHTWLFAGTLTDEELLLRVTDTISGEARIYFVPGGQPSSVADTEAF